MSKEASKADRKTALIPVCLRRELTALGCKNRKVFATSMRLKKQNITVYSHCIRAQLHCFFCCFVILSRREGGRLVYHQTGPDGSGIRTRASVEGVKGEHPAHTPCLQGVVGYTACAVLPKKQEIVQKKPLQTCNGFPSVKQLCSNDNVAEKENMKMEKEVKRKKSIMLLFTHAVYSYLPGEFGFMLAVMLLP